ncbi:MAG: TlyA family RNA methyltransferase [Ruminococcus sp.]|jgi:23S rRNA (cytidine1920-2'-O)/16S rRNA (cytidine1409-2'-O)-methyltransferase|nr:TlyA family RNA methyltransferase [Ruminococcus sp.]
MRLDLYLSKSGKVKSREHAKELIASGNVKINGETVIKPAFDVSGEEAIEVTETLIFAGRGGLKLEYALEKFGVDVSGLTCLDIGASTGGFTDCLLQRGAKKVYAVDTGTDQLAPKIKNDPRVKALENTDIRNLSAEDFAETIDFVTCDVSFISVTKILSAIAEILVSGKEGIILIKPQFEQSGRVRQKNGIIKNAKDREAAKNAVLMSFEANGFSVLKTAESYPHGKDGNIEYIALIKKSGAIL